MSLSTNQRDNLSTNCLNHVHEQSRPSRSLNMHAPRNTKSKRGTEANILQPKSLSRRGAGRSTFPLASAKLKKSQLYSCVTQLYKQHFHCIYSRQFWVTNMGQQETQL